MHRATIAKLECAAAAYESPILAGIHFHSDIVAGKVIGEGVAQKVLAWGDGNK